MSVLCDGAILPPGTGGGAPLAPAIRPDCPSPGARVLFHPVRRPAETKFVLNTRGQPVSRLPARPALTKSRGCPLFFPLQGSGNADPRGGGSSPGINAPALSMGVHRCPVRQKASSLSGGMKPSALIELGQPPVPEVDRPVDPPPVHGPAGGALPAGGGIGQRPVHIAAPAARPG